MTRLPLLVGACLLAATIVGAGAVVGAGGLPGSGHSATPKPAAASGATAGAESTTTAKTTDCADCLLVVENATTGERLLAEPVSEGTTVALNYTHSVEKTPVLDVYEVNGTRLEMVRMEFESYGAGLPARAEVTVTENDTFVFDPEGSYDRLYVTPGRVAGHELLVGDRTCDLVGLSNASTVKIHVTRRSAATTSTETR